MNKWTITYEEEQDDGSYAVVKEIEIPVPDKAWILGDAHWADMLMISNEPGSWNE